MLHSPQSDSNTDQQPLRELNLRNIVWTAWKDAYISIGSFIYLTVQLIAILTGYDIIVPERLRLPTILIAIFLSFSYPLYKIYKNLIDQNINLSRQIESLNGQNINLSRQIESLNGQNINLSKQIENLTEQNINLSKKIENLTDEITIQHIRPKDPADLIYDHLRYPDVRFAVYCLSKKIEESGFFGNKDPNGRYNARRNIIIGIDRGGAIVGGLLAKNLGVAVTTLAINWADRLPQKIPAEPDPLHRRATSVILEKNLDNIDFRNVKNILLVDDAIRKGDAMLAAKNLVRDKLNQINKPSHFVCDNPDPDRAGGQNENMININIACILYVQVANQIIGLPEFCVYQTKNGKLWLLWDTTRPEMKPPGEEKKLFDEYYNRIPKGEIGERR